MATRAHVLAAALVPSIAAAFLPLMIIILVTLLQGYPVLKLSLYGGIAAMLAAILVSRMTLRSRIIEIHISGPIAALRTAWEAIVNPSRLQWQRVVDVRNDEAAFSVCIGHDYYTLPKSSWPEWSDLVAGLERAMRRHQESVQDALDNS